MVNHISPITSIEHSTGTVGAQYILYASFPDKIGDCWKKIFQYARQLDARRVLIPAFNARKVLSPTLAFLSENPEFSVEFVYPRSAKRNQKLHSAITKQRGISLIQAHIQYREGDLVVVPAGSDTEESIKTASQESVNPFNTIPFELIFHILNFLDVKGLCRFASTARRYQSLSEIPSIWEAISKNVDLPETKRRDMGNPKQAIMEYYSYQLEAQYLRAIFTDIDRPVWGKLLGFGVIREMYIDLTSYELCKTTPETFKCVSLLLVCKNNFSPQTKYSQQGGGRKSELQFSFMYSIGEKTLFTNLTLPERVQKALNRVEEIIQSMLINGSGRMIISDMRLLAGRMDEAIDRVTLLRKKNGSSFRSVSL